MIVRKYIVKSMNEAISKIKQELGADAVIINQKKVKKSGLKGLFSPKMIEVTAAVDNIKNKSKLDVKPKSVDITKDSNRDIPSEISINAIKKAIEKNSFQNNLEDKRDIVKENNIGTNEIIKEVKEMKDMLNKLKFKGDNCNDLENEQLNKGIGKKLEDCDVNLDIIKDILNKSNNMDSSIDEVNRVRKAIEDRILLSKFNLDKVVVLVGPTGVGKTTTIAKMAGRLSLMEKKKVGLITVDTYRIGAIEQLNTYANIMSIPFKAVFSIKEMVSALEDMKDCDVVLIDTTGRSSKNAMQIAELNIFIQKINAKNIQLVISASTKNKDIDSIVNGYRVLNYSGVIITKLDETTTYGSILNILDSAKQPLSFVTTGQNVPDDFKRLAPKDISNLILGEELIC